MRSDRGLRAGLGFALVLAGSACRPSGECVAEVDGEVPTVVHVRWTAEHEQTFHVEYGVDGVLDESTPVRTSPAGERDVLLLGLPALTEIAVRVVAEEGGRERVCETTVSTSGLPSTTPDLTTAVWNEAALDPFRYLLAAVNGEDAGVLVIDRQGERVWFHAGQDREQIVDVQLAEDGSGLLYNAFALDRKTDVGRIEHVSLDGTLLETIATPEAHHVFAQDGEGFAWLSVDVRSVTDEETGEEVAVVGDALVELADRTSEPVTLWSSWDDFTPILDEIHDTGFYPMGLDWSHANTLNAVPERGTWMTALAHLDLVVEIDRSTGEVVRKFGREGYLVPMPGFPVMYPHDPHLTETGNLLVVSTDRGRGETRAVEYAIDEERQELHEVWSYGADQFLYADALGQAFRLPSGNTLINFGTAGVVREVTMQGEVVWEVSTRSGTWFAQVRPVDDLYEAAEPVE